jgi:RNA polymerase sigma-70 factor (ECF subfamily)
VTLLTDKRWRRAREAPPPEDERGMTAALRRGDLPALAWAFDRWHARVGVLARRLLSDEAAAQDVVQDTFAALPAAARRFRGDVDLETFLLSIAVKRARSHQRSAIRRRRALGRFREPPPPGPLDPECVSYRRQLASRLEAALDSIPLKLRLAFILCEVEGLSAVQVAVVAGIPVATVRTRLFHARRQLRDLLALEHDE